MQNVWTRHHINTWFTDIFVYLYLRTPVKLTGIENRPYETMNPTCQHGFVRIVFIAY